MFDGKTFLPVTVTPIRKIACMMRPLADADPVPFAVAILNANSLTRSMPLYLHSHRGVRHRPGERDEHRELAHVPRVRRAALGAQPAVQADVLVLHHHPAGLLQAA